MDIGNSFRIEIIIEIVVEFVIEMQTKMESELGSTSEPEPDFAVPNPASPRARGRTGVGVKPNGGEGTARKLPLPPPSHRR
ncbi:hypothetical protein EVAR_25612_1 [Eumeta japonica]|uniref:Uncharacterized protein n=1 Tax=Eumeta variegata TaxID=151549 RepID=A0A4C1V243_EUMVA|nr:hypothetical protein EVAR_25612_1 [Eumeta japonica]